MTLSSSSPPAVVPPNLLGMRFRGTSGQPTKRGHGHIESWFFKVNDPSGRRALWGRCTIFARPGLAPVAEAWAIAFDRHRGHIAVKSTVPFGDARFAKDKVDAEVDGCTLSLERARGALSSGRGSLAWDLEIGAPLAAPIIHYPTRAMYKDGLPPFSKVVTPLSDARSTGAVRVDRGGGDVDTWDVTDWPIMVGHNWGRGNAELYAWTHCNAWDILQKGAPEKQEGAGNAGIVFEAVSGRVRVGPLLSPMATSAYVRFRGQAWDLSGVRALTTNRGSISLRRWEMTGGEKHHDESGAVAAKGNTKGVKGLYVACEVAAETDDIVGLHYPNPTGPITHCLNTKLARARLELILPDGEVVTATSRTAALEIGTIATDHGIKMYL